MEPRFDRYTVQGHVKQLCVNAPESVGLAMSILLQMIGFLTQGWKVINDGPKSYHIGLGVATTCFNGHCSSVYAPGYNDSIEVSPLSLKYQAETSAALFSLVVASMCFAYLLYNRPEYRTVIVIATVVLTLVSGIFAMAAAGQIGIENLREYENSKVHQASPIEVPYSIILTGIGGLIAAVMASVIFFTAHPWKSDSAHPPYYEMPESADENIYPGQQQPARPIIDEMPPPPYKYVDPGQPQPKHVYQHQLTHPYADKTAYYRDTDLLLTNL